MTTPQKIHVAIIGCGNIATRYAEQIATYPHVQITGFQDLAADRARAFAEQYKVRAYETIAEVLADPQVDLVVNLTIHHVHAAVIRQCLEAGKHVHSEKPLALDVPTARGLVALAESRGLRLSCAPITYMGEAQTTAWNLIREGKAGTIRVVYAEVNHGRIETWHPNPEPFYDVGILGDVAVYPLTLLTSFFGPVRRVTAFQRLIYPHRVTKEGRPFSITTPEFALAMLEFDEGRLARLTANFYVEGSKQGGSLEFHGDLGRIYLESFQNFAAGVEFGLYGQPYEKQPLVRPLTGWATEFGRGVDEMATAMLENRPQRATGAQAAHIVEVIDAIGRSSSAGTPLEVTSNFVRPTPVDFAKLHPALT